MDRITKRKQAALVINTKFAPTDETNKPPNTGPTIPEMLNCKPLKVTAEGSSVSETTGGTIDVQVGALKANPTPREKDANQNEARIEKVQPTKNRQSDGYRCQPKIDCAYQFLTVDIIGKRAGGQCEQKER